MTKTQQIADLLIKNGYTEQTSPSRKYRKFTHPSRQHPLWLGKAAALRSGPASSTAVNAAHLLPPALR